MTKQNVCFYRYGTIQLHGFLALVKTSDLMIKHKPPFDFGVYPGFTPDLLRFDSELTPSKLKVNSFIPLCFIMEYVHVHIIICFYFPAELNIHMGSMFHPICFQDVFCN